MKEPERVPGHTASSLADAHEHGNCNLCDDLERQLAETKGRGVWLWHQLQDTAEAIVQLTIDVIHFLERERDGYKAQAKRRREALEVCAEQLRRVQHRGYRHVVAADGPGVERHGSVEDSDIAVERQARAAIDITPEEAKEGR